jgi:hypothetical protein
MRIIASSVVATVATGLTLIVSAVAAPVSHGVVTGRLINSGRVPPHSNVVEILKQDKVVGRQSVGTSGRFHFEESPGKYRLQSNRGCAVRVTVVAGKRTSRNIHCLFH